MLCDPLWPHKEWKLQLLDLIEQLDAVSLHLNKLLLLLVVHDVR